LGRKSDRVPPALYLCPHAITPRLPALPADLLVRFVTVANGIVRLSPVIFPAPASSCAIFKIEALMLVVCGGPTMFASTEPRPQNCLAATHLEHSNATK
jgi:hypothetical protein